MKEKNINHKKKKKKQKQKQKKKKTHKLMELFDVNIAVYFGH